MRRDELLRGLTDVTDIAGSNSDRLRLALERRLSPMVRLALRRAIGVPALVAWVSSAKQRLAATDDLDASTRIITRWLSAELLRTRRDVTPAGAVT